MKFLDFFNNTGKLSIRMTQSNVEKEKVNRIKSDMISQKYDFTKDSNKIGYEFIDNTYYITEGHHRMQAALEIWKETGNYEYVESLINNGSRYDVTKKPYNSFKFKI